MASDICGIYGIHNIITDKWYVGQSQNIRVRNSAEKCNLRKGYFHSNANNRHISNAWKKYGENAFEWIILEECSVDQLDQRETFWITEKNSFHNGYNQTLGGGGRRGWVMSEEHKQRLRELLKTRVISNETRKRLSESQKQRFTLTPKETKPVYQYTLDGVFVKKYDSVKVAADFVKCSVANIRYSCQSEGHMSASGFVWSHNKYDFLPHNRDFKRQKVVCVETEQVFDSLKDAAGAVGVSVSKISQCIHGNRLRSGGYRWVTYDDWLIGNIPSANKKPRTTPVICIETGEKYDSIKDAAVAKNTRADSISKICSNHNKVKTAGGYHWKYANKQEIG